MSWSLKAVSFRMSGSGSWKRLLPDEASQSLYGETYPKGRPCAQIIPSLSQDLFLVWKEASIVEVDGEWTFPLGPIMTDEDLQVLRLWFSDLASGMADAVKERIEDYRLLSWELGGGYEASPAAVDNILTILICALTLDSWVFSRLREEVIGTYPFRGRAGNFFFWGYAFAEGPQRIFGFTTYGGLRGRRLHMIRSHGLDRRAVKKVLERRENWAGLTGLLRTPVPSRSPTESENPGFYCWGKNLDALAAAGLVNRDDPSRPAVPLFNETDQGKIFRLCGDVSRRIMDRLLQALGDFEALLPRCSFARCSRSDVLCMLFHLAYSYATDRLVEEGLVPDFPERAGGEWGIWIA